MKKEQKTELSRKRIIEAAIIEFGKNGYKGSSVNSVCNAGIPKGLLYHNFKNRDEIYLACVTECYNDLLSYLRETESKNSLKDYLSARMDFFSKQTAKANIIMETMMNCPPNLCHSIEDAKGEFNEYNFNFFQTVLSNIKLRDNISEEDAMKYFSFMQLFFHSHMEELGVNKEKETSVSMKHEEILAKVIDIIFYGIAKGSSNENNINY